MSRKLFASVFISLVFGDSLLAQEVNEIEVVSHFRVSSLPYPTMVHGFTDGFSKTTIQRALNFQKDEDSEDAILFRIDLESKYFAGVPKWNGLVLDLPVNQDQAEELFNSNKQLFFRESRKWELTEVALLSVCEKEGDFVWIGFFRKRPKGAISFLPETVVYLKFDRSFIFPRAVNQTRVADLSAVFGEHFLLFD